VNKADIPECRDLVYARPTSFHSRDNRLKGDRRAPCGRVIPARWNAISASGEQGMSSRALILATVMLLVGCLAAERALAQATNLEAGKSPAQIFAGTCTACHKAPRGLLKSVSASSLSSFLRQHYTTSPEMAGVLASYLISNGASDTRLSGDKKGAKEGTKEARQEAKPEQLDRSGRRVHPGGAPPPEAAPVSSGESPPSPSQATIEAAREQNAKQKLSKRNKPGEELPRGEGAKEASTPDETAKPEGSKPSEPPSQSANAAPSAPGETPALRSDPVPPVTPAPAAGSEPAPAASPASVISAAISAETAPAVPSPSKPVEPPAVVAATAALPPVPPAGPPAPPISR
jgi:hypothetical protein